MQPSPSAQRWLQSLSPLVGQVVDACISSSQAVAGECKQMRNLSGFDCRPEADAKLSSIADH
jgi:hypothetical protein